MADQKKFCPLMTKGSDAIPCVEERCQWWFRPDGAASSYKGNCIVYAMVTNLHLIANRPK